MLSNLDLESRLDFACGSWISDDSTTTVQIRKRKDHFLALLLDQSRCYKIVRECFHLRPVKGKLIIFEVDGKTTLEQVNYDPETDKLLFGSYGLFSPEEMLLLNDSSDTGMVILSESNEF